jgi:Tfp pilus assembly protein PilX
MKHRFLRSAGALRREAGSTLIVGMMTLAVLALLAAATFQTVTSRFRSNYQMAGWHDALTSAESGVNYAFVRLRSPLTGSSTNPGVLVNPLTVPNSLQSDLATLTGASTDTSINGTVSQGSYTDAGGASHTFPRIQLPTLSIPHAGQGANVFSSVVTIDGLPAPNVVNSGTNTWFRIRSVGTVPLAGSASVGVQKYDNLLRKIQFHVDSAGNTLSRPQAVRTIEVVAKPITTGSAALFGQTGINLNNQNVVINSYDSRSSAKSTNGIYDPAKATSNGNIVTDDDPQSGGTPGVINLSPTGAYVYGNIATNNTPVQGSTQHVTGTITQDFYQTLPGPPNPATVSSTWTSVSGNVSTLATGTASAPARYKVSGSGSISLTGGSSLAITAPASGEGYVELWLPGDFKTTGNGQLTLPPHTHLIMYVDGSVSIAGNGIANQSLYPENFTLYGNHDSTISQSMTVDGNGQFAGVMYAPYASVSAKGGGSSGDMYGAIYANNISFTGGTSLHYDEALGDSGAVIDYRVSSWYEDNTLTRK